MDTIELTFDYVQLGHVRCFAVVHQDVTKQTVCHFIPGPLSLFRMIRKQMRRMAEREGIEGRVLHWIRYDDHLMMYTYQLTFITDGWIHPAFKRSWRTRRQFAYVTGTRNFIRRVSPAGVEAKSSPG